MHKTQASLINSINRDTFIISDHHFGHRNVTSFEPSRVEQTKLDNLESQEEMLIERHNKTVKPDDTVIFLGDFAFKSIGKWMSQLNGKIIFVMGNHDRSADVYRNYKNCTPIDGLYHSKDGYLSKFIGIGDQNTSALIADVDNTRIMFSHYAMFDQNDYDTRQSYIQKQMILLQNAYISEDCEANFHGHLHSNDSLFGQAVNCSAEKLNFYPKTIGELLDEYKNKSKN